MAKKKTKLTSEEKFIDKVLDVVEEQGCRLKQLIAMFRPDGTLVEFIDAPQIGDILRNTPGIRRLSEDEQVQAKWNDDDVAKKGSTGFELDYWVSRFKFQGNDYEEYTAFIMFKAEQDDTPIFVTDGFIDDGGTFPIFFVDGEEKKAFLILEGLNSEDGKRDNSFIRLSEFYAIITDAYVYHNDTCTKADFMVSFSQTDKEYIVEEIYTYNKKLIDLLIPPVEDSGDDKSVTDINSKVKATGATPEDKSRSEDNGKAKRREFSREFTISTVKRIKEQQLSAYQEAKELGIRYNLLHKWIKEYDVLGEEGAFRGKKSESLIKQSSPPPIDKDSLKKSLENSLKAKKAKVCDVTPAQSETSVESAIPCPDTSADNTTSDTATDANSVADTTANTEPQEENKS